MAIELHWLSGSPYAWRVQLALEIKELTYVSHLHQMSTGERAASKLAAQSMNLGLMPFETRWPAMALWLKRVEKLNGYERTYPPNWRGG
jgi:hypothetical protein